MATLSNYSSKKKCYVNEKMTSRERPTSVTMQSEESDEDMDSSTYVRCFSEEFASYK